MKLIGYLPTGYPSIGRSLELAEKYLEGGCDGLEMGIPYPDPQVEPDGVASAMLFALWKNNNYEDYFSKICAFKQKYNDTWTAALVSQSTVEQVGMERFLRFYTESRMACLFGVMMDGKMRAEFKRLGIGMSAAIQWDLNEERVQYALSLDSGIVYLRSKPASEAQIRPGLETMDRIITYLRERGIKLPIYAGVGIRTPDDIKRLKDNGVEGCFLGSSLMRHFDNEKELLKTVEELAKAAHN